MAAMNVRYDPDVDALYIKLRDPVGHIETEFLDVARYIDYDEEDNVVGIEILDVSTGVDLEGLPEPQLVADLIRELEPFVRAR